MGMDGDWPAEDQPQMDLPQPREKQQTPQFYKEKFQMQQALYHDFSSHNNSHYGGDQFDGSEYSPNYDRPHQRMRQNNMVEVKSEPVEEEFGDEKDTIPLPSTSRQMIASPIIRHRTVGGFALMNDKGELPPSGDIQLHLQLHVLPWRGYVLTGECGHIATCWYRLRWTAVLWSDRG